MTNLAPAYMNLERQSDGLTEWGWIDFGFQTYYALLNCGFRMRVSAGTASGVHPVQLGFGRVYVHLPDGFSYDEWIAGLNQGRSFVTTGPMLEVTFNNEFGRTYVQDREPRCIRIACRLRARHRVRGHSTESKLIVNGRIEKEVLPKNLARKSGGFDSPINVDVGKDKTHWVAVRCFEKTKDGRLRFAHTNPVFVDIADRPLHPRAVEVDYFIKRMTDEIARNEGVLSDEALAEYREALSIYERMADAPR